MNFLGFYAAIALGGVIGGFLTLMFVAAWLESKRWKRIYGPQHYTVLRNKFDVHGAAAAIKRSADRG